VSANRIESLAKALYENGNPQHTAEDRAMLGPFEELDLLQQTIWIDLANAAQNHIGAELRDVMAERDVLKATVVRVHTLADDLELRADAVGRANPHHTLYISLHRQHVAMIRAASEVA